MTPSVERWAARTPDRVAVVAAGAELTYSDLAEHVRGAMRRLQDAGARQGDRVAVVATHCLDTVATIAAVMELGATVVPLHARLTQAETERVVSDVRPRLIVGPDGRIARRDAPSHHSGDLAILYTSGSTGAPRGMRLSSGAFAAAAAMSAENLGWRDDDRWLLCMTLAHVGGLSVLVRCLIAGACVVMPELPATGGIVASSGAIVRSIVRDRVTLASLVPTTLEAVMESAAGARASGALRAVLVGGARAPQALVERACALGWPLLRTYGMTEACSQIATQPLRDAGLAIDDCGPALPGIELRAREDGSLGVRSPAIASGIVGSSDAVTDETGWCWTGDVGRVDARGRLHVLGRRTEMIVTGGENVWPAEVERVLESLPGVASARVVGLADRRWGEVIGAVVITAGESLASDRVAAMASERLAPHRRPRRWVLVAGPIASAGEKLTRACARALLETRGTTS
ncbi:MAG: AMP-binding protein [Deltaproteobacteria bacterium]|nr:AMP-binding protein [Deltaproteobacteria bacterium]